MSPRELRALARDMSATAFIIEMRRRGGDPGASLVVEYMSALRSRRGRWMKVLLCLVDGRRCAAHPTGGRCAFACQRHRNVTLRTIR